MESFTPERISTGDQIVDFCLNDCSGLSCCKIECEFYGDLTRYSNEIREADDNKLTDFNPKNALGGGSDIKRYKPHLDNYPAEKYALLLRAVGLIRYANTNISEQNKDSYPKRQKGERLISEACNLCNKEDVGCRIPKESLIKHLNSRSKSERFKKNLKSIQGTGIDTACGGMLWE